MTAILDVAELSKRFTIGAALGPIGRLRRRWSGGPERLPQVHAVDNVSFVINKGETVGLVGESGCGKSTLVRMLTRLLDQTEGSVKLGTRDLSLLPAKRFGRDPDRARIQMVFQDAGDSINPRFTAFDAIADPLRRLKKLRGKKLKAKVEQAATRCGLPLELLYRFPHQLSGGQRARVGIARAIAVEPDLLLLDEPTAALDVSVQVVILQLLAQLKAELGMSYLFVSHDLGVVRLICDRVIVMYLGKIVEAGPAKAVFERPLHPYTQALVAAVPRIEAGVQRLRLSGEPRSPIDPDPNVCRFYGRCPRGTSLCETRMPVLRRMPGGREVACHFAEEVPETNVTPLRARAKLGNFARPRPKQPAQRARARPPARMRSRMRAVKMATMTRRPKVKAAKAKRTRRAAARRPAKPAKRRKRDPLDDFITAAASSLDLPCPRAWHAGVKANVRVTLQLAALFMAFPLPDEAEPAPVFEA